MGEGITRECRREYWIPNIPPGAAAAGALFVYGAENASECKSAGGLGGPPTLDGRQLSDRKRLPPTRGLRRPNTGDERRFRGGTATKPHTHGKSPHVRRGKGSHGERKNTIEGGIHSGRRVTGGKPTYTMRRMITREQKKHVRIGHTHDGRSHACWEKSHKG